MRFRKRTLLLSTIGLLVLIVAVFLSTYSAFPGNIRKTDFKVTTRGVKSIFKEGSIYRYPGIVPLLEVKGEHYEMGLQYGVLLKPEILKAVVSYEKILRWQAENMGIPFILLTSMAKYKANEFSKRIPKRFLKEITGVSDGSGVSFDTILTVAMFYDIGESMGCSGILMRGKGGTIIHGRNQDSTSFGGEEIGKMSVIVKYHPTGYNSVTQLDWPLFMGIETGYNNKGLAYSEETLRIKKPNPDGFPIVYLSKLALEEASTIDDLYPLFDKYPVIGAYGSVWSDRDTGEGLVAELTAVGWAATKMEKSILWNFNHIYNPKLKKEQIAKVNLASGNWDREKIATVFAKKDIYQPSDAVDFLRAQLGPGETDYAWHSDRRAISNSAGHQMIVFHPKGDGVYAAFGPYHAARHQVFHIHDDFSIEPDLYMESIELPDLVRQIAVERNRLTTEDQKLTAFQKLADKNSNDATIQFLAAKRALALKNADVFAQYALNAYSLESSVPDYALFAGLAEFHRQRKDKAIELLEGIDRTGIYPNRELLRVTALIKIYKNFDSAKQKQAEAIRDRILLEHDAQSYYESYILPRIEALES